jgi:hypothetical protein
MAGAVGLMQVPQDDVHLLQDLASHAQILGDPQDEGHAKVHQNLGHVPHQHHEPPVLSDIVHHSIVEKPP